MKFSPDERQRLLALKGVGPTVVSRLEQLGFSSLHELGTADVSVILEQVSAAVGSSCWKNSPQARGAIEAVVALGRISTQRGPDVPTSSQLRQRNEMSQVQLHFPDATAPDPRPNLHAEDESDRT